VILGRGRHPERLPWYAAGRLDAARASAIERHLRSCDACRAEVEALRSVYRGMRESAPGDHISPERLVDYNAGDPRVAESERRLIEAHVRECHPCSADLAALERADAATNARHSRRLLGAAASLLLVAAAGWHLAGGRVARPESQAVARVVFPVAQRGPGAGPRLTGAGPWELEVWLPVHATASSYLARIHRTDESSKPIFETVVAPSPGGDRILLLVSPGLRPGHHVLTLTAGGSGGSDRYVRGFEVEVSR
jgi:hypothetical protein